MVVASTVSLDEINIVGEILSYMNVNIFESAFGFPFRSLNVFAFTTIVH